jgi:protein SCO1/2
MGTINAAGRGLAIVVFLLLTATELTLGGGRAAAAPEGSPWGADYFPNVALVNQDGKNAALLR